MDTAYYGDLDGNKWRNLALDVWTPVWRRNWDWNHVTLWTELLHEVSSPWHFVPHELGIAEIELTGMQTRENEHGMSVARTLHFIIQQVVENDYGPLVRDLLLKGNIFEGRIIEVRGKSRAGSLDDKARIIARAITSKYLVEDPLFWALANLANYKFPRLGHRTRMLPLPEIMEVAGEAIRNKSDAQLAKLKDSHIYATEEEFAALPCMISTLESLPGFKPQNLASHQFELDKLRPLLCPHTGVPYKRLALEWNDIFESQDKFNPGLIHAGKLLKQISTTPLPQWYNDKRPVLQLRREKLARERLNDLWKEIDKQRVDYVMYTNSQTRWRHILALFNTTLMQKGYSNTSHLEWIQQRIEEKEREAATTLKVKKQPREGREVRAGSYIPIPSDPLQTRNRQQEIQESAKSKKDQVRVQARTARLAARIAAPGPGPIDPVPQPKQVPQSSLEVFARCWPYASETYDLPRRITWANCMTALGHASMTSPPSLSGGGSHVTFKGADGSMTFPSPHGGASAAMTARQLIWLGRQCTRDLGWSWATFDPQAASDLNIAAIADLALGDEEGAVDRELFYDDGDV